MSGRRQATPAGAFGGAILSQALAGAEDEGDQQRRHDPARDGEHGRSDATGGGDPVEPGVGEGRDALVGWAVLLEELLP